MRISLVAVSSALALVVCGWFFFRTAAQDDFGNSESIVQNDDSRALASSDVHHSKTIAGANDPIDHSQLEVTSLESKLGRRLDNAIASTGLSEEELASSNELILNNFYGPAGSSEFLARLHGQLKDQVGVEEADFQLNVVNAAGDWQEVKSIIADRATFMGGPEYYDSLLMDVGIRTGGISAEEVEILVGRGAALPPDAVFGLASQGNVEAIKGLDQRGLLVDRNYEDPMLSMNAIGAFIRRVSNYPGEYDPEIAREGLSTLINIGVETQPTSGSLDPLDFALQYTNKDNADIKLAIVKALIENGAVVEESHIELLRQIRDVSTRKQLEKMLARNR